jgi:hypothetical protein
MMRRLAVLACLALPAAAAAQITINEQNDTDLYINIAECKGNPSDNISFQWTATSAGPYDLYVSDTSGCPPKGSTVNGVTTNANTASVATGVQQSTWSQSNTAGSLLNSISIPCSSTTRSMFVCVFTAGTTTSPAATGSIGLDLVNAPPPEPIAPVGSGDSSLTLSWNLGAGSADPSQAGSADRFRVYARPTGSTDAPRTQDVTGGGSRNGRISGLTNGVTYDIWVTAITIGGNESQPSTPLQGTPVPVNDFWRLYQNDGGKEQGGCATGAAGLAALAALAPLAWRKRRSRP